MPSIVSLGPGTRPWHLAVRICGRLIADNGRILNVKARNIAVQLGYDNGDRVRRPDGSSRGSRAHMAVTRVVQALKRLELADRDGSAIVALDLADLAAWLADELAECDLRQPPLEFGAYESADETS